MEIAVCHQGLEQEQEAKRQCTRAVVCCELIPQACDGHVESQAGCMPETEMVASYGKELFLGQPGHLALEVAASVSGNGVGDLEVVHQAEGGDGCMVLVDGRKPLALVGSLLTTRVSEAERRELRGQLVGIGGLGSENDWSPPQRDSGAAIVPPHQLNDALKRDAKLDLASREGDEEAAPRKLDQARLVCRPLGCEGQSSVSDHGVATVQFGGFKSLGGLDGGAFLILLACLMFDALQSEFIRFSVAGFAENLLPHQGETGLRGRVFEIGSALLLEGRRGELDFSVAPEKSRAVAFAEECDVSSRLVTQFLSHVVGDGADP
jgi:hypothetical protein